MTGQYLLHGVAVAEIDDDGRFTRLVLSEEDREFLVEKWKSDLAGPLLPRAITDSIAESNFNSEIRSVEMQIAMNVRTPPSGRAVIYPTHSGA